MSGERLERGLGGVGGLESNDVHQCAILGTEQVAAYEPIPLPRNRDCDLSAASRKARSPVPGRTGTLIPRRSLISS
jgi:uracil-DNA glycosylase